MGRTTTMNYKLAKKLKDAGFPQRWGNYQTKDGCVYNRSSKNRAHVPDLSELIDACGDGYFRLENGRDRNMVSETNKEGVFWMAYRGLGTEAIQACGNTRKEAVANLWLKLNK